jgi:hypothetical protein
MRKMLILGALPMPFEGPWVPLGSGAWLCDFLPELAGIIRIEVEDLTGTVQAHLLQAQLQVTGKQIRAVVLEEIPCVSCIHLGVSRVA